MAKIHYDYYNGKDVYNDGEIEQELYDYYKNQKEINFDRDDIFYLTTPIRENIIAWYPFEKEATILEVGAGVGTITSFLCKSAKRVISVEGSKRRAEILYERHKEKKNLDIFVGNFNDIEFEEKFDYIVLIGVFEYSKIFFPTNNPFEDFLDSLQKKLNKNGKILIAIENRYGIKYWAGNKEDHLGKPYSSLYNYEKEKVQTFGKNELIKIIKKVGIPNYKFYYPFPDYKMPQIIYTDNYEPSDYELESLPIYNYSHEIYNFFPQKVLPGLRSNEMLGFFANSFIVELSPNNKKLANVSYAKFQPTRNQVYNIVTILTDDKKIYKKPLNKEAIPHLKELIRIHKKIEKLGIKTSEIYEENQLYYIEFLKGKILEDIILEKKDEFEKIFEVYVEFLYTISKRKKITNPLIADLKKVYKENTTDLLKIGLLDLNLGNVMLDEHQQLMIFDQEWETNTDIPVDYAIYFSLKLLFEKHSFLELEINVKKIYKKYNITKQKQKIFDKISMTYFNDLKKVNNIPTLEKLLEHKSVVLNDETENLKNDLEFYKNLLEKTKIGYETEINRLNTEVNALNHLLNKTLLGFIRRVIRKLKKR